MLKLRVSDLKQYIYCPRVVYFTYVCPVEKKLTRKMVYGSEAHLELDRLEKRRTFKRYNFKEGERKFHTSLYSPRLGLEGRLDMHIVAGKEIFPVEFKHSAHSPSLNHKYQLVAYAMLLEDVYNKPVRYGFICNTSGLVVPLEITPNSRVFVKEMLEKMRLLVSSESMPKRASHKTKCIDCEFHNFCGDVR